MDIVVDASCIVAVLLGEETSAVVKEKTRGTRLVSPTCLPYEIGNSLTAGVKRHRISEEQAITAYERFERLPVRLVETDIRKAVRIAAEEKQYAYDACYIACALDRGLPLYSLDHGLIETATKRGVRCL